MQTLNPSQSREHILQAIQAVVGNSYREGKVQGRLTFCPHCGKDISRANGTPGQLIRCPAASCGYVGDRAFIFDTKILWLFNRGQYPTVPLGELLHFAVGAIIKREDRYLLLRRTLYPSGSYVIPAGHLEQGESPAEAMIKEVYEETGMTVSTYHLLLEQQPLRDGCRRGVDYHVWNLYACECVGELQMNYEADQIGWYTAEALHDLPLGVTTQKLLLAHNFLR